MTSPRSQSLEHIDKKGSPKKMKDNSGKNRKSYHAVLNKNIFIKDEKLEKIPKITFNEDELIDDRKVLMVEDEKRVEINQNENGNKTRMEDNDNKFGDNTKSENSKDEDSKEDDIKEHTKGDIKNVKDDNDKENEKGKADNIKPDGAKVTGTKHSSKTPNGKTNNH